MSEQNIAFDTLDEFKKAYLPERYKREQLDRLWEQCLKEKIAATAEANKRIEALELEVQNWKDFCKKVQKIDFNDYLALQADNKRLREALVNCLDMIGHEDNIEYINKVLAATPAESLQAFENEVIEKCAKVADRFIKQEHEDGNSATALMLVQDYIRALKGK